MRRSSTGWRATVAPGLLVLRDRSKIDVDADVGDQRDLLAVFRADDEFIALFGDLEIRSLDRFDGVDRGARIEALADLRHRRPAGFFACNGVDRLLDGEEFDVGRAEVQAKQG